MWNSDLATLLTSHPPAPKGPEETNGFTFQREERLRLMKKDLMRPEQQRRRVCRVGLKIVRGHVMNSAMAPCARSTPTNRARGLLRTPWNHRRRLGNRLSVPRTLMLPRRRWLTTVTGLRARTLPLIRRKALGFSSHLIKALGTGSH